MTTNLQRYNDQSVVEHYTSYEGLTPAETLLFDKYVRDGDDILDLGVGGGRTTPYLSAKGHRYVGIDYSASMIDACRQKYPSLEFCVQDASDLTHFADDSFDIVVFSFNGIDYFQDDATRLKCLQEVRRVLRPSGRFIFSSHNARHFSNRPMLSGANPKQFIWRILRFIYFNVAEPTLFSRIRAFYKGAGYVLDPTHGGLMTFVSTPKTLAKEGYEAGLELLDTANSNYPDAEAVFFSCGWRYYVFAPLSG